MSDFWNNDNKTSNKPSGNMVPWSNVTGKLVEFTEVNGRPVARVELSTDVLGDQYASGTTQDIFFPEWKKDIGERISYLQNPDQGDAIQPGGTLIFENVKLSNGVLEAAYVSTMAPSNDVGTDVVLSDVVVRAAPVKEYSRDGNVSYNQNFEVFMPEKAITVKGDGVNPIRAQIEEMKQSGADAETIATYEDAASQFDQGSSRDKALLAMNFLQADSMVDAISDRLNYIIRVTNLDSDPADPKSYKAVMVYAPNKQQAEDGNYYAADAETVVDQSIVNSKARNADTIKQIWGVVDGSIDAGNVQVDIIPVAACKAPPRLRNKMKKLERDRQSAMVSAFNPEGSNQPAILKAHVAFRGYKDQNGEASGNYFVRSVQASQVVNYMKNKEVVTSYRNAWSPSISMMPTPTLPEAFRDACNAAAQERGAKLDPNARNDMNNDNSHDEEPSYENEASPMQP